MSENKGKKVSKDKVILFSGMMWLALAAFGMLFDPGKDIVIILQFMVGAFIIIYYLFFRK
jgi:hypothetical protein